MWHIICKGGGIKSVRVKAKMSSESSLYYISYFDARIPTSAATVGIALQQLELVSLDRPAYALINLPSTRVEWS